MGVWNAIECWFLQRLVLGIRSSVGTLVINDWAKILDNRGQVDTFILDFEQAFDTPLVNSLKANYLAMELVARH